MALNVDLTGIFRGSCFMMIGTEALVNSPSFDRLPLPLEEVCFRDCSTVWPHEDCNRNIIGFTLHPPPPSLPDEILTSANMQMTW